MTRLVESDVRVLTAHLNQVERALTALTGCDFVALAARACGVGVIPGFVECVAAICSRLGCRAARVTSATDVADSGVTAITRTCSTGCGSSISAATPPHAPDKRQRRELRRIKGRDD